MKTYTEEEVVALMKLAWEEAESQYSDDYGYNEDTQEETLDIIKDDKSVDEFIKQNLKQ